MTEVATGGSLYGLCRMKMIVSKEKERRNMMRRDGTGVSMWPKVVSVKLLNALLWPVVGVRWTVGGQWLWTMAVVTREVQTSK